MNDKNAALDLAVVRAAIDRLQAQLIARNKIRKEGEDALSRLFEIAHQNSGQARVIAKFLLGCYNGERFPFNLTDFRCLDTALFEDCLAVLKMDSQPQQEVHCYFPAGGDKFERLARDWQISEASQRKSP